MEYSIQNLSKTKVEIAFSVDRKEWENDIQNAYIKNKHKYSLEGFRKGKVPRSILEKKYGVEVFFEDAIDLALQKYYGEILDKEETLYPISQPEVDIQDISIEGLKVVITVEVKPEVELGQYKDIEVEKTKVEITDSMVDAEIAKAQEKACRWVDITDREVKEGDQINLDYSGSVDGVKFEGGTAEKQNLTIGSKMFIPGFEEQLIGMKIGENKDINVKFPEQYGSKELAGKDSVFNVTINEIKEKELPTVDDEFIKDISEFDTVEEYRAKTKEKLSEDAEQKADMAAENKLLEVIVDNASVELPQCLIDAELDDMIKELEYRMMYQGIKLEDYLKFADITLEQLKKEREEEAVRNVKTRMAIEEIIKKENLQLDKEEIDAKIEEMANAEKKTVEEYKKTVNQNVIGRVMNQLLSEKFFTFIKENNKIVIK